MEGNWPIAYHKLCHRYIHNLLKHNYHNWNSWCNPNCPTHASGGPRRANKLPLAEFHCYNVCQIPEAWKEFHKIIFRMAFPFDFSMFHPSSSQVVSDMIFYLMSLHPWLWMWMWCMSYWMKQWHLMLHAKISSICNQRLKGVRYIMPVIDKFRLGKNKARFWGSHLCFVANIKGFC